MSLADTCSYHDNLCEKKKRKKKKKKKKKEEEGYKVKEKSPEGTHSKLKEALPRKPMPSEEEASM